jgi:selenocysteine lyase/cysteine desulfurase
VAQDQIVFRNDATKYEVGTHNLIGIVGLIKAMELGQELGISNIAADLLRKRKLLVPSLQAKGWTVLNAEAGPENASGIVSFFQTGTDMTKTHAQLQTAGIITSLRGTRSGQNYIRVSPHFYNTDEELERFLNALESPV